MPRPPFPTDLRQFQRQFATEEACQHYLAACRWPEGFRCPQCGHDCLRRRPGRWLRSHPSQTTAGRTGLLGLERGSIRLTLDCPMDGHGRNACVSLEVNDADAYFREWSTKVSVLRSPRDEEWGARTFDLLDPSGNTIFVIGPVPRRK